jgi:hypothetical protein
MKAPKRISDEDHEYAEWKRGLQPIEASLRKKGAKDLSVLKGAGIDRERLVRLLAVAASGDELWKDVMRSRKEALLGIARRMDTLANDAEKQANDPLCNVDGWISLNGGHFLGMARPESWAERDPCVPVIIAGMRAWAKIWKGEARRLGGYLRTFAQTDSSIVLLLLYVRSCAHGIKHFDELARLLTDAFEAAGKHKSFSADGLRQTYKRNVPRLVHLARARSKAQELRKIPPVFPAISIPKITV